MSDRHHFDFFLTKCNNWAIATIARYMIMKTCTKYKKLQPENDHVTKTDRKQI